MGVYLIQMNRSIEKGVDWSQKHHFVEKLLFEIRCMETTTKTALTAAAAATVITSSVVAVAAEAAATASTTVDLAWVLNTIFSRFNSFYTPKCKRPSLFVVAYFIHTFASELLAQCGCDCDCDCACVYAKRRLHEIVHLLFLTLSFFLSYLWFAEEPLCIVLHLYDTLYMPFWFLFFLLSISFSVKF